MGKVNWRGPYTPSTYEPIAPTKTLRFLMDDDAVFKAACELAGIEPTRRQYSKWRNGRGIARAQHTARAA